MNDRIPPRRSKNSKSKESQEQTEYQKSKKVKGERLKRFGSSDPNLPFG